VAYPLHVPMVGGKDKEDDQKAIDDGKLIMDNG
jgi:hypothetical protein